MPLGLGIPLGTKIGGFSQLISRAVPLSVTNTRSGATGSMFAAGADVAANGVDYRDIGGLRVFAARAAHTHLVTPKLSAAGWVAASVGGTAPSVSEPSPGVYRIVFASAEAQEVTYTLSSVSTAQIGTCDIRLVSGSITTGSFGFRNEGSGVGTPLDLATVNSEFQTKDCLSTAVAHDELSIYLAAGETATIEIRNMRCVAGTVRMPPAAYEAEAGTAVAADLLSTTIPAGITAGCIASAFLPYNWSGSTIAGRRWQANGNWTGYTSSGLFKFAGSGYAPDVSSGVSVPAGVSVIFDDWDSSNIGIQANSGSLVTSAETDVPAGALYIGNRSGADLPIHACQIVILLPFVLTAAERVVIKSGLESLMAGVALQ